MFNDQINYSSYFNFFSKIFTLVNLIVVVNTLYFLGSVFAYMPRVTGSSIIIVAGEPIVLRYFVLFNVF